MSVSIQQQGAAPDMAAYDAPVSSNMRALHINGLHWWTSDEDIEECIEDAEIPLTALHSVTFMEHKYNGQSKGECFIIFKADATEAALQKGEQTPAQKALDYFKEVEVSGGNLDVVITEPGPDGNPPAYLVNPVVSKPIANGAPSSGGPTSPYGGSVGGRSAGGRERRHQPSQSQQGPPGRGPPARGGQFAQPNRKRHEDGYDMSPPTPNNNPSANGQMTQGGQYPPGGRGPEPQYNDMQGRDDRRGWDRDDNNHGRDRDWSGDVRASDRPSYQENDNQVDYEYDDYDDNSSYHGRSGPPSQGGFSLAGRLGGRAPGEGEQGGNGGGGGGGRRRRGRGGRGKGSGGGDGGQGDLSFNTGGDGERKRRRRR